MFSYKVLPLALLISLPAFAMENQSKALVLAQAAQESAPELLNTTLALEQHDEIAKRKESLEARKQELQKKLAEEAAALDAELKQADTEAEKNAEALEKLREKKSKVVVGVDKALAKLQSQLADTEKKKASELALEDVALANILKEYDQERKAIDKKEATAKETFASKKTTIEKAYDVELQKLRGSIAVQEKRRKERTEQLNDISLKINDAKPAVSEDKAKEATSETSVGLLYYINPLNLFGRSTSQQ